MKKGIVTKTLQRIEELYVKGGLPVGNLSMMALKPTWYVVIGNDEQCGVAMNFTSFHDEHDLDLNKLRSFVGKNLIDVAHSLMEMPGYKASALTVAAISALSRPLMKPELLAKRGLKTEDNDISQSVKSDDIVAMVGYAGIVGRIVGKCREFHVTEMRPRTDLQTTIIDKEIHLSSRGVEIHTQAENKEVLGKADLVFITASTLVNGTIDELLTYPVRARSVTVYGPTGTIIPDVLLENGVHRLTGISILDAEKYKYNALNDLNLPGQDKTFDGQKFTATIRI
jgi:uncharacterized protein (DUF4213/DUF364 family)